MRRRCWRQLGPRSAPRSLRGELRPARDRFLGLSLGGRSPVAVRSSVAMPTMAMGLPGRWAMRPLADLRSTTLLVPRRARAQSSRSRPAQADPGEAATGWLTTRQSINQVSRRLERQSRRRMATTGLGMRVEKGRGRIEPQCTELRALIRAPAGPRERPQAWNRWWRSSTTLGARWLVKLGGSPWPKVEWF